MKAVILAGGLGTRLSEETHLRPKPMVEIGSKPILWHIMKIFSSHGIKEFIICCGYKGYIIKEYFFNYSLHLSDLEIDLGSNKINILNKKGEDWKVTVLDTGERTQTGGRLKRAYEFLKNEESFCFTYGDGLADINITDLISYHNSHKKLATITAVLPPGRYGALNCENNLVKSFQEKPRGDGGRINGGFFVLSPKCIPLIKDDNTAWEEYPLKKLAEKGELMAYTHDKFWQPMDTLREKNLLEQLWKENKAPWKTWS